MRFDEIFLGGDKSAPVEGLASEARIQELHIIGFPRWGCSIDLLECRTEMTCHLLVVEALKRIAPDRNIGSFAYTYWVLRTRNDAGP